MDEDSDWTAHETKEEELLVSFEGFDGPMDLLLSLAREQKVDLAKLPVLSVAEQYLAYIDSARKLRLEIAADYLVMAAWLAYLKSRMLLPDPPEDEEARPEDMAEALKFQLLRLEAMKKAAQALQERPQLDSEVFLRGQPEKMSVEIKPTYHLPLYDLLAALGAPARRKKPARYNIAPSHLFSLEESLSRMRRMLGGLPNWGSMEQFLPPCEGGEDPLRRKSAVAATFSAVLEMVKEGELELQQAGTFAPIYVKSRKEEEKSH